VPDFVKSIAAIYVDPAVGLPVALVEARAAIRVLSARYMRVDEPALNEYSEASFGMPDHVKPGS
jgi:hypothetical protein